MKNICASGFKLSIQDKKALEHYLVVSPKQWAQDALAGMLNKAVKTIIKDWLETYKLYTPLDVPSNPALLIPAIVAMPNFKPYNRKWKGLIKASRKNQKDQEIWEGGFNIEDWQETALNAFYSDYRQDLYNLMENKIACRKEAFKHEFEQQLMRDPTHPSIPKHVDDLIDVVTAQSTYKNRAQKEAEISI